MKREKIYSLVLMAILSTVCFGAGSGEPAVVNKPGVGLTIYNDNFAVVREARNMKFDKGQNTVRFTDVASAIDPTSVKFTCLSSPGAVSVLEQNYEYDLVNTDSLLKRYIDKQVVVANGQGVMSDPNPSALQGEWEWMPGVGFITAGEYSAYLIFGSAYAPTAGSFTVKAPEESDPGVPNGASEVPEPGILALFGIASAMFAAKRGKKRQAE